MFIYSCLLSYTEDRDLSIVHHGDLEGKLRFVSFSACTSDKAVLFHYTKEVDAERISSIFTIGIATENNASISGRNRYN
jgi:hypothetical protein